MKRENLQLGGRVLIQLFVFIHLSFLFTFPAFYFFIVVLYTHHSCAVSHCFVLLAHFLLSVLLFRKLDVSYATIQSFFTLSTPVASEEVRNCSDNTTVKVFSDVYAQNGI